MIAKLAELGTTDVGALVLGVVDYVRTNVPPRRELAMEPEYCDYCEREGHSFGNCPARDDEYPEDE